MKTTLKFLIVTFFVTILSACAGSAATAQNEDLVSVAYTDAAMTLGAQIQTSTPMATVTPFPTLIPTLYVPPTFAEAVSPTAQSATSYISYSTANGCNDAVYVSDVTIADGTVLAPGESFTKTWEFQNTGTCDWDENYLIIFTSGSAMSGETTEIDQDVLIGSTGDISVYLTAPDTEGAYTGYWRMANSDSSAFGQSVYVMIVVSDDASTLTPTATATATDTDDDEVTSTPTPTSTPQATATLTSTSTATTAPTNTSVPTATSETSTE